MRVRILAEIPVILLAWWCHSAMPVAA